MVDAQAQARVDGAALIRAIAARQDRAAFAALFGFYAPRIKTFLMRRGASAELAEDLAQEAMIAIWRKAASFDPGRATAAAWIFSIARNLRIDVARREAKSQDADFYDLVMPDDPAPPDSAMLAIDSETHVRAAMQALPPEQLDVVRLSYFEGKAHSGIAEALQIPIGTVKSRLRLATKRLRELLGDLS
jgi:RNA polymerase sigma-70 factor (ECF subfamily)